MMPSLLSAVLIGARDVVFLLLALFLTGVVFAIIGMKVIMN
jgi:hypothetical protein